MTENTETAKTIERLSQRILELEKADEVRHQGPSRLTIPRWLAEEAYAGYVARVGGGQSLDQFLARGGFADSELDQFVPGWSERVDTVTVLRDRISELEIELEDNKNRVSQLVLDFAGQIRQIRLEGYEKCEKDVMTFCENSDPSSTCGAVKEALAKGKHRGAAAAIAASTENVRVHATLNEGARANLSTLTNLISRAQEMGLVNINEERLNRFGILTGDLPRTSLETLASLSGIESVQTDNAKRAK